MKYKNKNINKLVLLFCGLAFIVLIFLVLEKTSVINFYENSDSVIQETTPNYVNLSPPTEEESSAGNAQKDAILTNNQNEQNRGNEKNAVTVVITDAGQYDSFIEVRAFIPDYFEDGTCTVKFTNETNEFEKIVPAFRDSSTTICTNPEVQSSEFTQKGEWIVTVTYESSSAIGQSNKTIIIE